MSMRMLRGQAGRKGSRMMPAPPGTSDLVVIGAGAVGRLFAIAAAPGEQHASRRQNIPDWVPLYEMSP
ncbi:hypothetical protein CA51_29970 [Rosistilla oblonga]|nr:hypothetical protein CA51_29970 [Rosistilla oblonga]